MATTATNKQPLLVDRVFHSTLNLDNIFTNTLMITGTNSAEVLVNGDSSDGAIIEAIYVIGRGGGAGESINLYMSRAVDFLRANEASLVATFTFTETVGVKTEYTDMPRILAPTPHVSRGSTFVPAYTDADDAVVAPVAATAEPLQFRALYLPKGVSLWAARQSSTPLTNGPIIGAQGGFF